jgi:8-oxo-dGTP pyrophosphatase MutT (NUDIX family)
VSDPDIPNVLATKCVYRSDALGLRVDTVATGDVPVPRHVVEYRPACAAVVTEPQRTAVLLIRHYRHPIARYLWELPGGMIERGESPAQAAAREVWEETGVAVRDLRELLSFHPEPAFTDHRIMLFEATADRRPIGLPPREHEIEASRWVTIADLPGMIRAGEIASSWTIIGLTIAVGASVRP